MPRSLLLLAPLVAGVLALPAVAQDLPAYRDDRSDGAALIASYYNALDRQEYARAWSYWLPAQPPVADFEAFAAGFAGTGPTGLHLGPATGDGAAGSLYTTVPVAIETREADGSHAVYAGCFVLRLVQPMMQETPPYAPLHIESAHLSQAEGPAEGAVPATCPER